ncbi:hypothetical protein HYU15_01565 [Candidatus Woesearchaeota archaeon]|nr:hypothetical protein [Candidatus Woesearchaeota archaeon]
MGEKFDISNIKTTSFSKHKGLILPEFGSAELAYLCGILAGDGHISCRNEKEHYHVECSGNPKDEKELYDFVICPLIKKLFNVDVKARNIQKTYGFKIGSKRLVHYLTDVLGLPKNKKYNQLKIPNWIKKKKGRQFITAYIRGLADTDFCLTLKKRYKIEHYYPVITGASKSQSYMEELVVELEKLGLKVSRSYNIIQLDDRFKSGYGVIHRMHIYGATELIKWMNIIGFYSPKHINKFETWKVRNTNTRITKVKKALNDSRLIKVGLE